MFPSVTGMMLFIIICAKVTSAPRSAPCGIKNIFATLCSNPNATNVVMGQKMAKIFPATLVVAIVPHTARHTSQLHRTPLTKATPSGNVALLVAIPTAAAVAAGAAAVIAIHAAYAMNTLPAKFPMYENTHDRINCVAFTAPFINPLSMTKTFPVNNSPPVRITRDNPAGNPIAPLTNALNPGFEDANPGDDPPTQVMSNAPSPMSAPAENPNAVVVAGVCAPFFSLIAHAASNVAGGGSASARVITRSARRRRPGIGTRARARKGIGDDDVNARVVVGGGDDARLAGRGTRDAVTTRADAVERAARDMSRARDGANVEV